MPWPCRSFKRNGPCPPPRPAPSPADSRLGYAVSLVVFSSLADRISARTVYLHSLFASGVCSMAFAFLARDFLSGLILHTLLGLSLGGTYTTGVMIIADQYAPARRGMAVGSFIASTSCGYALSLIISGIALPRGGYPLSFFLTCLGPMLAWIVARITLHHTVGIRPGAAERSEVHQGSPGQPEGHAPHLGIHLP